MAKPSVLASKRLFFALDQVSKNTLIDVLIEAAMRDAARAIDRPDPTDDLTMAVVIQRWLDGVLAIRNDKPKSLARAMVHFDALREHYLAASLGEIIPTGKPGAAKFGPALHKPEEKD